MNLSEAEPQLHKETQVQRPVAKYCSCHAERAPFWKSQGHSFSCVLSSLAEWQILYSRCLALTAETCLSTWPVKTNKRKKLLMAPLKGRSCRWHGVINEQKHVEAMLVFHEAGSERSVNTLTNDSYLLHQASTWLRSPLMMTDLACSLSQAVFFHMMMKR